MDDLLALFDEEAQAQPDETANNNSVKERPVDSLPAVTRNGNISNGSSARNVRNHPVRQQQHGKQNQIAAAVDHKVGIRMLNRKISSTELLDLIAENEYHSPASLCAMSLSNLNQILVQPASVLDLATVCGRTRILSVGVVFTNSGTRMSQAGNAFCALTLGNMASGPAISLLLFGSAYGKFTKAAKCGKVLAIMNPRLIPQKPASTKRGTNDMAVTFSISDEQQIRMVADAQDFGICKAMVASKNEQGKWIPNSKRCTKHVDLRKGEYCQSHSKEALIKKGKGTTVAGGSLAQLWSDARDFRTSRMFHNTNAARGVTSFGSSLADKSQIKSQEITHRPIVGSPLAASLRPSIPPAKPPVSNQNSILTRLTPPAKPVSNQNSILNPYQSTRIKQNHPPPPRITSTSLGRGATVRSQPVKGDWLQEATLRSSLQKRAQQQRRIVNTDSDTFDGSVPIPKPCPIFARGNPGRPITHRDVPQAPKSAQEILQQQKNVAAQLSRSRKVTPLPSKRIIQPSSKPVTETNREDLLYGSLGDIDVEKVLNAKSRFANEVDAEEYARARQRVNELELDEARKEKTNKNKTRPMGSIQKEWHCANCQRPYSSKPSQCYVLGHTVKIRRKIQKQKSTTEKRQELSERDAKDGGLKLGQGLEWSRWSRFN